MACMSVAVKPPIGNDPGLHAKLPLFKWQWPLAALTDIVEKGTEAIPTTAATTATIASIVNVFIVIFYLENIDIILLGRNQSSCLF
jgi:hypothetical protein